MLESLSLEVKRIFSDLEKFNRGNPLDFDDEIYLLRKKFTERRSQLLSGYMNHPAQFAAYSSFHFPLHLPEVFWILEQVFQKTPLKAPKKILDLGCGPGTASLSAKLWLQYRKKVALPQTMLVDTSKRALDCAKVLHASTPTHSIRSNIIGLKSSPKTAGQDWIFLSHVLNELGSGPRVRDQKIRFLDQVLSFLNDSGFLFIIEPPLKEPTLDLMWLRDQLTESHDLQVLAPCPEPSALCPMLLNKMGWCYAQPPRTWAKAQGLCPWDYMIKKVGKIGLSDPGFSYLVLSKKPFTEVQKNSRVSISDSVGKGSWICQGKKISKNEVPFRGAFLDFEAPVLAKDKSKN